MRRISLGTPLIGINVGLLLLAVAGVAFFAVTLLGQLADDQALARVAQAGTSARNAVGRSGDQIQTSARLLGERPTLLRLLQAGDHSSLSPFLLQFQMTSHLDGVAVMRGGRMVAQAGSPLDWEAMGRVAGDGQAYLIARPSENTPLVLGAWAPVPSMPDARVWVAVLLDESFSREIGAEIGLEVRVVDRPEVTQADSRGDLRTQALTSRQSVTARLDDPGLYLAALPLQSPSGEVMGLIETELPATEIDGSLRRLTGSLVLLAVAVAALAGLANFAFGRRLARPLRRLAKAARRIGQGDFTSPIPAAPSAEIGALAATLEEMRRHLLRLTADLRRQQAESDAILTGIVEGVFAVDRGRRIRYLNPQTASMLGIPANEALGRFCGDVLKPAGPGEVRPCEEHCPIVHSRFRAGARATEHLRLKDGARRTVVITSAPPDEQSPNGELRQVQVMRDETDVEATRRLRDAVLANISHEFRTPLSAQLASIELLLEGLPGLSPRQVEELVRSLQRGALRLTQLIDNLLESVRIEAGQVSVRRRPVDLRAVIDGALELTRPLIEQRQQLVEMALPGALPPVSGDAPRLTQVLVNLLANANKFAPSGSTIRIGGEAGGATVSLWVEDQGPGLPEPGGSSLFVPFVRSTEEEPEQSGVGLGLWIVKSIVERHGGHVDAQSSAAGTRVRVTLPRGGGD